MNVMDRQTLLSAKPRDCPTVPWDGEDIRAEERVQHVQQNLFRITMFRSMTAAAYQYCKLRNVSMEMNVRNLHIHPSSRS